jgi:hypothetical protein
VSEMRTVEISIKQIIAVVVVLFLIGVAVIAFVTRDTWVQLFQSEVADTEEVVVAASPTSGVTAAERVMEIVLAMQVIDYRNPEGWLATLHPLATDRAYNHFKTNYVEKVWSVLKAEQVVINPDQVTVIDKGIEVEGEKWQVRAVDVHIDDPPEAWGGGDSKIYVQLLLEDGDWKLQAIVTEDELSLLKSTPTKIAGQIPDTASSGLKLPTPDTSKDLPAAFAEQFLVAFHAIDYRDMETWLARMKAMSNMSGYALISSQIYLQFLQSANENKFTFSFDDFTAKDQGVELEGETILGMNQVRKVFVEGPEFESGEVTGDMYLVMIVKDPNASPDDIFGGWRFEQFLNQEMLDYIRGGEDGER